MLSRARFAVRWTRNGHPPSDECVMRSARSEENVFVRRLSAYIFSFSFLSFITVVCTTETEPNFSCHRLSTC